MPLLDLIRGLSMRTATSLEAHAMTEDEQILLWVQYGCQPKIPGIGRKGRDYVLEAVKLARDREETGKDNAPETPEVQPMQPFDAVCACGATTSGMRNGQGAYVMPLGWSASDESILCPACSQADAPLVPRGDHAACFALLGVTAWGTVRRPGESLAALVEQLEATALSNDQDAEIAAHLSRAIDAAEAVATEYRDAWRHCKRLLRRARALVRGKLVGYVDGLGGDLDTPTASARVRDHGLAIDSVDTDEVPLRLLHDPEYFKLKYEPRRRNLAALVERDGPQPGVATRPNKHLRVTYASTMEEEQDA